MEILIFEKSSRAVDRSDFVCSSYCNYKNEKVNSECRIAPSLILFIQLELCDVGPFAVSIEIVASIFIVFQAANVFRTIHNNKILTIRDSQDFVHDRVPSLKEWLEIADERL